MTAGLKNLWNLNDPHGFSQAPLSGDFKTVFKEEMQAVAAILRPLLGGDPRRYQTFLGRRDRAFLAYQKVSKDSGGMDDDRVQETLDAILAYVAALRGDLEKLQAEVAQSQTRWQAKAPLYETAVAQAEDLDCWRHPKSPTLLQFLGSIDQAVGGRRFDEAAERLDKAVPAIAAIHSETLAQQGPAGSQDGGLTAEEAAREAESLNLKGLLARAKKKPLNFAFMLGKSGPVLEAHPRKEFDVLIERAKKKGGGTRGAWGTMRVDGTFIVLDCQNEPPGSLGRLAKGYFVDRGHKYRIQVTQRPGGVGNGESGSLGETGHSPGVDQAAGLGEDQGGRGGPDGPLPQGEAKQGEALPRDAAPGDAAPGDVGEDGFLPAPSSEDDPDAGKPFGAFKVDIKGPMGSDELTNEAYRQFLEWKGGKKVTPEQAATFIKENKKKKIVQFPSGAPYEVDPKTKMGQDILNKGYAWLHIVPLEVKARPEEESEELDDYLEGLSKAERDALNDAADRAFADSSQAAPGEKIPSKDHPWATAWLDLRKELIAKKRKIDKLPPSIKEFFMSGQAGVAIITPDNEDEVMAAADQILEIAARLQKLSDSELAGLLARREGEPLDLNDLKWQVENYLIELSQRKDAVEERVASEKEIVFMEQEYDQLREFRRGGAARAVVEDDLAKRLKQRGYEGDIEELVAQFEADVQAYEEAFRDEAVEIAFEGMDHYERDLDRLSHDMMESAAFDKVFDEAKALVERLKEESVFDTPGINTVLAELKPLARENPLLKEILLALGALRDFAQRDNDILFLFHEIDSFDDPKAFRNKILALIREREEAVENTRARLREDPEFVWKTGAVEGAKRQTGVEDGDIYSKIVHDRREEVEAEDLPKDIALGVAAIAAGLVSGGTGTVAVVGAAAAAGISAFEAWEIYTRYADEQNAHDAGLMSTDPSVAWVVVALAGLAADVFGLGGAVRAVANAARARAVGDIISSKSAVGKAVAEFNAADPEELFDGEVAGLALMKFEDDINKAEVATRVGEIELKKQEIREAIIKAAHAEAKARSAWETGFKVAAHQAHSIFTGVARLAGHITASVCYLAFDGIQTVKAYAKTHQAKNLIGEIEHLNPARKAMLVDAYDEALKDYKRVADFVGAHEIGTAELDSGLAFWATNPTLSADDFMDRLRLFLPESTPIRARGTVHNTSNKSSIPAPDSVMDENARNILGHDSLNEEFAGTGGIEKISATKAEDGSVGVTIEGELLPHRLQRDGKKSLEPDQTRAPNYNDKMSKQSPIKDLGFADPDAWDRCHLWGPGFGDEAMAGMMLGPKKFNVDWQSSGIEGHLRDLAAQIAPHRADDLRLTVAAKAESWGTPTPGGFKTATGERLLKRVEYDITLKTPEGSFHTRVTIDIDPDPADINAGASPKIRIDIDKVGLGDLFAAADKHAKAA